MVGSLSAAGAFGLSLPLLSLLGSSPAFFVVHQASLAHIVGLILVLGGLPLASAGVPYLLRRTPTVSAWVHLVLLFGWAALAAAATLVGAGAGGLPAPVFVMVAAGVGAVVCLGFVRSVGFAAFLSYLGWAPVVVAVWFIAFTPVVAALSQPEEVTVLGDTPDRPVPVVVMILDEFPLALILDGEGKVDDVNFPGFGELAADGVMYRNTTSVHTHTLAAVPAILTRQKPESDQAFVHTANLPSVFTMLGPHYDAAAVESATALCPAYICHNKSTPPALERWSHIIADVKIVAGHTLSPKEWTSELPSISGRWAFFEAAAGGARFSNPGDRRRQPNQFLDLIGSVNFGEAPPLRVGHFILPHHEWQFLADGRLFSAKNPQGNLQGDPGWDRGFFVAQVMQRAMMQTQYVDSVVAEMIDRMKDGGWYEDALVVVVADHGTAFSPGCTCAATRRRTPPDGWLLFRCSSNFPKGIPAQPKRDPSTRCGPVPWM